MLPDAIGDLVWESTNGPDLWPVVHKQVAQLEQAPHAIIPDQCPDVPTGRLANDGLDHFISARETLPPLLDLGGEQVLVLRVGKVFAHGSFDRGGGSNDGRDAVAGYVPIASARLGTANRKSGEVEQEAVDPSHPARAFVWYGVLRIHHVRRGLTDRA